MKRDTKHCPNCGVSLEEKDAVTKRCTVTGHYTKNCGFKEDSHSPDPRAGMKYKGDGEMKSNNKVISECHSDDYVVECNFNTVKWLQQATAKEIIDLADSGWGGDYAADTVAIYMAEWDDAVAHMFKHIEMVNATRKEHIGFECNVPFDEAMSWLRMNRPVIYNKVQIVECTCSDTGTKLRFGK